VIQGVHLRGSCHCNSSPWPPPGGARSPKDGMLAASPAVTIGDVIFVVRTGACCGSHMVLPTFCPVPRSASRFVALSYPMYAQHTHAPLRTSAAPPGNRRGRLSATVAAMTPIQARTIVAAIMNTPVEGRGGSAMHEEVQHGRVVCASTLVISTIAQHDSRSAPVVE
jgi:hypothetical protein